MASPALVKLAQCLQMAMAQKVMEMSSINLHIKLYTQFFQLYHKKILFFVSSPQMSGFNKTVMTHSEITKWNR